MKILVTNNTLKDIGGSETYAYAFILQLHSSPNIEVHAFSPQLGLIAEKLKDKGVKVVNKITEDYDVVFASHTTTIPFIKHISGVKIMTCHGIFPIEEQPMPGINLYVAITKEVQRHLSSKKIPATIIWNGVDCDRFRPKHHINRKLKTVLSLSHSDHLNQILKTVCDARGLELISHNKHSNPVFYIENVINKADLVVTLGRGAYEAMACARNVLILDERPYINRPPIGDGILNDENFFDFINNNCSGRFSNKVFTESSIHNELDKYDSKMGVKLRSLALTYLNIKHQTLKYLELL